MGNNPKLGLVNVDNVFVHTKFGQILSIHSQDIERKPNVQGTTESRNYRSGVITKITRLYSWVGNQHRHSL